MHPFNSPAAVREALEHYCLRPSKTTGRPLSAKTGKWMRYIMTDTAAEAFASGLTGNALMWDLDRRFETAPKTYRSIGIVALAQFANYYGLLNPDEYRWWCAEGNARYKPEKPVSERILSRATLKAYFDPFLEVDVDRFTQARLYCYSSLLLLSGARHNAIITLKSANINITETVATINITRLKSANTALHTIHIPMDVPLPNGRPVGEAIHGYLNLRPESEYFFTDWYGKHGSGLDMSIRHQLHAHASKYCERHITPHMFRFTCASIVADHVGIKQAQQILGHAQMSTTLRYAGHFYDNVSSKTITTAFKGFADHKDESYIQ